MLPKPCVEKAMLLEHQSIIPDAIGSPKQALVLKAKFINIIYIDC